MPGRVTIVMYHFVRDLARSRYPRIKGLDLVDFIEQIDYIRRYYTPITMEALIDATRRGRDDLPRNAILLTFDDGYKDHFENVLPILAKHRIQGSFFPPAKPILERCVLDVNKIHFTLAVVEDKGRIVRFICSEIEKHSAGHSLDAPEAYYRKLAVASRYDSAEVVFIKRALQKALPEQLRAQITARLFAEFVTRDEEAFADELYMSVPELGQMRAAGMHIGSHGYSHCWLDSAGPAAQLGEVERSLAFLGALGCDLRNWTMCYPYGAYDDSLLSVVASLRCAVGVSTEVAIADTATANPLALPRLDTNDLPKRREAAPNAWTLEVM
jgi:peptidoglycan/xylan/chitin deacetylase (PgdA/CDA1 family)